MSFCGSWRFIPPFSPILVQRSAEEWLEKGQYTSWNKGTRGREEVISWWQRTGERNILNNLFIAWLYFCVPIDRSLVVLLATIRIKFRGVPFISRKSVEYPCQCTINKWRVMSKVHFGLQKVLYSCHLCTFHILTKYLCLNK